MSTEPQRAQAAWPWMLAYAALALPFAPLWPDYEAARLGLGNVGGALALLLLTIGRPRAQLPAVLRRFWIALIVLHGLTCLFADNSGDAMARTAWLGSLLAIAALAAGSSLHTQLVAVTPVTAVVAGFGLAQACGLTWPFGYLVVGNPVSTLGNLNVAAELTTLGTVAAAILTLRDRARWSMFVALLGVAYLWVNHSRSGLLATAIAIVPLLFAPSRHHPLRRRLRLAGIVLLGLAGGQALRGLASTAPPVAPPAANATAANAVAPSTIEVRLEIWSACLHMLAAAPWLGVGAGQFKVHYPRFRTQQEIELSTHGREFAAAPLTAHNDPLEVAVETGLLGLVLYAGFWCAVLLPRRRGRVGLLPIAAFLVLGFVRSPLGNAPVAVFTFACVGAVCASRPGTLPRLAIVWRLIGVAVAAPIAWLGVRDCAGQCAGAAYMREDRKLPEQQQTLAQMHALDAAVAWCPWNAQLRALRATVRFHLAEQRQDLGAVRALLAPGGDFEVLLRHTPLHTTNLRRAARAYQALGDRATTRRLLERILTLDPPNPEARLFLATELTLAGDASGAVATLYAGGRPHLRLWQDLEVHLQDLAAHATDAAQGDLLRREAAFVTALDALSKAPTDAATLAAVQDFMAQSKAARDDDLRPWLLFAVASVVRASPELAVEAAERAPKDVPLLPAHAELLADVMQPLRALPSWQRLLPQLR